MKLLLDTHILLWAAGQPEKLSESTRILLTTPDNSLFFSAVSIWEVGIKLGLGRGDFKVDSLPLLHKDPFDRLLLAQARAEGMVLVTGDATVSQYQESVLAV